MTEMHLEHVDEEGNLFYSCNFAVVRNPLAVASNINEVTCKNCLKLLKKTKKVKAKL